jgi:broad specificity phosphatase PhoE
MSEIVFIRHAETDMAGRFCGHSDPEVNSRGYLQISRLIESLRQEKFSAVYTSDLTRAETTAMTFAQCLGIGYRVRSSLREISFGHWEGLSWDEIEQRDEVYAHRWITEYPHLPAPGGERFDDFENRVLNEVKSLTKLAGGHDIAVVTHAGVLRVVLCALHGCSEERAWELTKSYCCIVRHTIGELCSARTIEVSS